MPSTCGGSAAGAHIRACSMHVRQIGGTWQAGWACTCLRSCVRSYPVFTRLMCVCGACGGAQLVRVG
eukprot:8437540-Alexandrium_andersonii.AAC.1